MRRRLQGEATDVDQGGFSLLTCGLIPSGEWLPWMGDLEVGVARIGTVFRLCCYKTKMWLKDEKLKKQHIRDNR